MEIKPDLIRMFSWMRLSSKRVMNYSTKFHIIFMLRHFFRDVQSCSILCKKYIYAEEIEAYTYVGLEGLDN